PGRRPGPPARSGRRLDPPHRPRLGRPRNRRLKVSRHPERRYSTGMASTVVFDLDKVLLGGDASTLFLHGRLRQAPRRLLLLLLAAPLLVPGALIPQLRPLSARLMTRIAVGGRS